MVFEVMMLYKVGDVRHLGGFSNFTGACPSLPVPAGSTERGSPVQNLFSDNGPQNVVQGLVLWG